MLVVIDANELFSLLIRGSREAISKAKLLYTKLRISLHLRGYMSEKIIRRTFSIPKELKERIDKRPDINWPEIFKEGLRKKLEQLEECRRRGLL